MLPGQQRATPGSGRPATRSACRAPRAGRTTRRSVPEQLLGRAPHRTAEGAVDERECAVGTEAADQLGLVLDDRPVLLLTGAQLVRGPALLLQQRRQQQQRHRNHEQEQLQLQQAVGGRLRDERSALLERPGDRQSPPSPPGARRWSRPDRSGRRPRAAAAAARTGWRPKHSDPATPARPRPAARSAGCPPPASGGAARQPGFAYQPGAHDQHDGQQREAGQHVRQQPGPPGRPVAAAVQRHAPAPMKAPAQGARTTRREETPSSPSACRGARPNRRSA